MSSNTFIMEKNFFERQLYNKCSSYIDANMHYDLVASDLILSNQTIITKQQKTTSTTKSTKKSSNIKKVKQVISNKIKRILHLNDANEASHFTPKRDIDNVCRKKLSLSMTKSKKASKYSSDMNNSIKLVNFKLQNSISKFVNNDINQLYSYNHVKLSAQKHRRCSDGQLSCGSSGSEYDNHDYVNVQPQQQQADDLFDSELFMSNQITHLFNEPSSMRQQQEQTWFDCTSKLIQTQPIASSSIVQTSTPNVNRTCGAKFTPTYDIDDMYLVNSNMINQFEEFDREEDEQTCNYNDMALMMDESTQVPVDSPVLIESTFNTSSCSNLSDDLIILQTAIPNNVIQQSYQSPMFSSTNIIDSNKKSAKKSSTKKKNNFNKKESTKYLNATKNSRKSSWNLSIIQKEKQQKLDQSSLMKGKRDHIPQWAVGHELNLAIVNQLYYNPSGKGVFNSTSSTFASKLL